MHCANCHTDVPDNAKFCPECGAPLSVAAAAPQKTNTVANTLWSYFIIMVIVASITAAVMFYLSSEMDNSADGTEEPAIFENIVPNL